MLTYFNDDYNYMNATLALPYMLIRSAACIYSLVETRKSCVGVEFVVVTVGSAMPCRTSWSSPLNGHGHGHGHL